MPDLFDYINAAMQRTQCSSERKLCEMLGLAPVTITKYRKGSFPSDKTMMRLAELAGRDKWQALIDLNIWRSENDDIKREYETMRDRLKHLVIFWVALSTLFFANPSQATVNNALNVSSDKCDFVYYGKLRLFFIKQYQLLMIAYKRIASTFTLHIFNAAF